MNLTEAMETSETARSSAITDPLGLGYRVSNIPATWRRARPDTVGDTPAATWIDSVVFNSARPEPDALPPFASVALLMAWRLSGLARSVPETMGLLCALTEELPGWSQRHLVTHQMDGSLAAIHLLGTLDSPYGPLICNSHNVVFAAADGEIVVVQLSTTATMDLADVADQIRLVP